MWYAGALSVLLRGWGQSLPGITKRLFMINHMMEEPPPERFIGPVDTDSLVVKGKALLQEQLYRAILMGRNQFQQGGGKVKHILPTLVQAAISCHIVR